MKIFNIDRRILAIAAAGSIMVVSAQAAPISGAPAADLLAKQNVVENVATYCYNRATGQFKHWGPCTAMFRTCGYYGCRLERRFW
ncbi:hypothetical protein [Methylobacterium sp. J-070]|uniref:hypothetical protein n=1 Tax=Methylobacterium sp. J-070 TaxID=2836650 RepID=UPI001FB90405|nr:hypothetical protein [Methylobacterium sp. J-070]MCJ2052823.1 hypothetical protein [Methylobacterium sp. J-070]